MTWDQTPFYHDHPKRWIVSSSESDSRIAAWSHCRWSNSNNRCRVVSSCVERLPCYLWLRRDNRGTILHTSALLHIAGRSQPPTTDYSDVPNIHVTQLEQIFEYDCWKITSLGNVKRVKKLKMWRVSINQSINQSGQNNHRSQSSSVSTHNRTSSSAIAVIADRTACSILMLFIVTAISRPLNKNPFAVNTRIQQLLRICVRNPQSAHLRSHRVTVQRHRVIVDKRADSQPESHRHLWRF